MPPPDTSQELLWPPSIAAPTECMTVRLISDPEEPVVGVANGRRLSRDLYSQATVERHPAFPVAAGANGQCEDP